MRTVCTKPNQMFTFFSFTSLISLSSSVLLLNVSDERYPNKFPLVVFLKRTVPTLLINSVRHSYRDRIEALAKL
jgi:hypothetical protein